MLEPVWQATLGGVVGGLLATAALAYQAVTDGQYPWKDSWSKYVIQVFLTLALGAQCRRFRRYLGGYATLVVMTGGHLNYGGPAKASGAAPIGNGPEGSFILSPDVTCSAHLRSLPASPISPGRSSRNNRQATGI